MAESPDAKRQKTEEEKEEGSASVYSDTNNMPRAAGRMLHIGLTDGELANRVVIVGHVARAELLAKNLQPEEADGKVFTLTSDRGYTTYTGMFQGQRLSVVSIGMGLVMVDFFLREARQVVKGPMAVVRFGTCGVLQAKVPVGTISVASEGSVLVQRNYAAFPLKGPAKDNGDLGGYLISEPSPSDAELTSGLVKMLKEEVGDDSVVPGMNATADSFYGSQGRRDPCFPDANQGLIEELCRRHPALVSMEMETYMLLHLAQCASPAGSVRASAAAVNVANRQTGDIVNGDRLHAMERDGGRAIMRALAAQAL